MAKTTTPLTQWIRAARGKLTQEEFAERVGVARETVARWEGGSSEPSYKHLAKIAQEFPESILIEGAPPAARALLPRAPELKMEQLLREYATSEHPLLNENLDSVRQEILQVIGEGRGEGWAGLAHGLLEFLKKYDEDLTPREKTFLMKTRILWDRKFDWDESFWWLIVKLFMRGHLIPPSGFVLPVQEQESPPTPEEVERQEQEGEKRKEEEEWATKFKRFQAVLTEERKDAKGGLRLNFWQEQLSIRLHGLGNDRVPGDERSREQLMELFAEWMEQREKKEAEESEARRRAEARRREEQGE